MWLTFGQLLTLQESKAFSFLLEDFNKIVSLARIFKSSTEQG